MAADSNIKAENSVISIKFWLDFFHGASIFSGLKLTNSLQPFNIFSIKDYPKDKKLEISA